MNAEMLEQNLKCPICFNIVDEPYESSCCGHLFCNKCIKGIKKMNCPICRSSKANFRENFFVKHLINDITAKCPYGCDKILPLSVIKSHRYECRVSLFKCSIIKDGFKCIFEGTRRDSIIHFSEFHSDQMILLAENFPSLKNTFDKHSMLDKITKIIDKQNFEKKNNLTDYFKNISCKIDSNILSNKELKIKNYHKNENSQEKSNKIEKSINFNINIKK